MSKWMSDELENYLGELAENSHFQPPQHCTLEMLEYLDNAAKSDVAQDLGDWLYQAFPGQLDRRMAGLVVIYWGKVKSAKTNLPVVVGIQKEIK